MCSLGKDTPPDHSAAADSAEQKARPAGILGNEEDREEGHVDSLEGRHNPVVDRILAGRAVVPVGNPGVEEVRRSHEEVLVDRRTLLGDAGEARRSLGEVVLQSRLGEVDVRNRLDSTDYSCCAVYGEEVERYKSAEGTVALLLPIQLRLESGLGKAGR